MTWFFTGPRLGVFFVFAWVFLFPHAVALAAAKASVAAPNILWHNQATGENKVWLMEGCNVVGERVIRSTNGELDWKMAGRGDFDRNGHEDILWQNLTDPSKLYVWYFTNDLECVSVAQITPAGNPAWQVVGVDDFNRDGWPDILWRNATAPESVVWFMKNTERLEVRPMPSNGIKEWKIVGTGQYDTTLRGRRVPDLVLRHSATGQNAVWLMEGRFGTELKRGVPLDETVFDQDWQIVGTGDYDDGGRDDDILWRHATLGLNMIWRMDGTKKKDSLFIQPLHDPDWRIMGQDPAPSTWRLDRYFKDNSSSYLMATPGTNSPQITLNFKIFVDPGRPGITVERRSLESTQWVTLQTNLMTNIYTDASVLRGQRYEYRIFGRYSVIGGGGIYGVPKHILSGVEAQPIEARGRVLLLVDETWSSQLKAETGQFMEDLQGDGWTVVKRDVPRHDDKVWTNNPARIAAVKSLIAEEYKNDPANTKAVILLGHVAVPYSGTRASDGHYCAPPPLGPDHSGAWSCDMYYTDMSGKSWADAKTQTNCNFELNSNRSGDGKFDLDNHPDKMAFSIGRIDFAQLPSFKTDVVSTPAELDLLKKYLRKNHRYRHAQLPWQSQPPGAAMIYGYFTDRRVQWDTRDSSIYNNAVPAFGSQAGAIQVGDILFQKNKPFLWGFQAGPGYFDRINWGWPQSEHSALHLAQGSQAASAVFFMLTASYMPDFNTGTDNYLRALLTDENFGLASMWALHNLWRLDAMTVGEDLGMALTRMVNGPGPENGRRDLAILGDPTLRMHIVPPPIGLAASMQTNAVKLEWSAQSGASYFVYRAAERQGPYTRLSEAPVQTNRFTDSSAPEGSKIYMVRARRPVRMGNGSYMNISQGTFVEVK